MAPVSLIVSEPLHFQLVTWEYYSSMFSNLVWCCYDLTITPQIPANKDSSNMWCHHDVTSLYSHSTIMATVSHEEKHACIKNEYLRRLSGKEIHEIVCEVFGGSVSHWKSKGTVDWRQSIYMWWVSRVCQHTSWIG